MRKNCRRGWVAAVGAVVVASLIQPNVTAASADRPNVLFIVADDLGIGDLRCYGMVNVRA